MSSSNDIDIAQKYGVNKSLLSKWKKDAKNIEDVVAEKHKRLLKKVRPSTRHSDLFKQLHQRFATVRSKGRKVSYACFTLLPIKLTKKGMELTLPDCQKVWLLALSGVATLNYAEYNKRKQSTSYLTYLS